MRNLILLVSASAALQVTGWAAPCMTGTLESYIALGTGGCILGSLQVGAFAYKASASGGAAKITADQITVTPLLVPVGSFALQFSAPWSVESTQSQGSHITYHIGSPTTPMQIQQITLDGSGFQAGMFGNVIVNEAAATPAVAFDLQAYLKCDEVCRSKTSSMVTLQPAAGALVVTDRVNLQSQIGAASLGNFVNWFIVCIPCV